MLVELEAEACAMIGALKSTRDCSGTEGIP